MIVPLLLAIGALAALSGAVRLVLLGRRYLSARESDEAAFDRDRALALSILSVTVVITGVLLVYIVLVLEGVI